MFVFCGRKTPPILGFFGRFLRTAGFDKIAKIRKWPLGQKSKILENGAQKITKFGVQIVKIGSHWPFRPKMTKNAQKSSNLEPPRLPKSSRKSAKSAPPWPFRPKMPKMPQNHQIWTPPRSTKSSKIWPKWPKMTKNADFFDPQSSVQTPDLAFEKCQDWEGGPKILSNRHFWPQISYFEVCQIARFWPILAKFLVFWRQKCEIFGQNFDPKWPKFGSVFGPKTAGNSEGRRPWIFRKSDPVLAKNFPLLAILTRFFQKCKKFLDHFWPKSHENVRFLKFRFESILHQNYVTLIWSPNQISKSDFTFFRSRIGIFKNEKFVIGAWFLLNFFQHLCFP